MLLLPQLLWMWVYGLLSVALIACAGVLLYLVYRAPRQRLVLRGRGDVSNRRDTQVAAARINMHPAARNTMIGIALILLLWPIFGHHILLSFLPRDPGPTKAADVITSQHIARPDGTQLHVELSGPADGPVLVLTHGWSLDTREWGYLRRDLGDRFRLITWDLPGLGRSTQAANRDSSLDKMAADLQAVLGLAGKPAVLVGHSIGGMINLTYCRQHPEQIGHEVAGLVQIDTTYTNPVKTTKSSNFDTAMQKPLYEPLLQVTIALSPLVRVMNWLSYQNGFSHVMAASSSFAGTETREQLDYSASRNYEASPAVVARGMLAMLHWDATPVLPGVHTQTLILEGQQDTTTVPAASEFMRTTMPAAELRTVDRAAHLGVLEQNQLYNREIRRFAETCLRPSERAALR